jgi:PKD repeat protein
MYMKKLYILSAFVFFCAFADAQITIDASDAPPVGATYLYGVDTTLSEIGPGPDGMGQSWDFTGFDQEETLFTSSVDPAATPGAASFPDADIALETGGLYSYAIINEDGLFGIGGTAEQEGFIFTASFDPPQQLLANPTSFGTTFTNNFGFEIFIDGSDFGADSVWVKQVGTTEAEVTASGMVTVPGGTYESLRLTSTITTIDSVWIKFLGNWLLVQDDMSTTVNYEWWGKDGISTIAVLETDIDGNPLSFEYLIEFQPPLAPPVAAFTTELMGNGTIQFTDGSSNNPDSWLWDFGDGTTSTAQNPVHTYEASGEYTVCLTAANDTGEDTFCTTINIVISSVDELEAATAFLLFPNPASNVLNIRYDESLSGASLTIYNALGQEVLESQLQSSTLDISRLAPGHYQLLLYTDGRALPMQSFVKQ